MSSIDREVVIVSNRGPVTFESFTDAGETRLRARRGSGGLVSGLAPLLESGTARWVAAALSDGDRLAASAMATAGNPAAASGTSGAADGIWTNGSGGITDRVDLVSLSDQELSAYYDTISNETLWFVHHGLYDLVRSPSFDDSWWEAWRTYEVVNERFASKVADVAGQGATVLVQDYHLTLVGETLRAVRPDLALVHFLHTPFAGPDNLRVLPDAARGRMLHALSCYDACGFHTPLWARNFTQCLDIFDGVAENRKVAVFASTLSSDTTDIAATAASPECRAELARLDETFGDSALIVRVDRMELSKNIVRGFQAFDLLLESAPHLRGRVSFLACCYPSRENVAAYRRYRDEVVAAADAVNERWASGDRASGDRASGYGSGTGDDGWKPIHLETDDNYPRSVAALLRYDVLVVNPIRDGLNLVAKEGPAINERSGQLVLSDQAGAFTELGESAFAVNPFDISATARAIREALSLTGTERVERSRALGSAATRRTPADWLDDQLEAAGR